MGFLIVVNLMFSSASFSLCGPRLDKAIFAENVTVIFGPFSNGIAPGPVNEAKTAQIPEPLRELRDFR